MHLDLPAGSSREECDRAWTNCFQPLLGALHHTPEAVCGLVLAGELLVDLEEHHPDAIEWIRGLVDRGQVELIGTALYEPVLSALPERDAIGQIAVHAAGLRRVFGTRPTGCWIPHGVWEPTLPRVLQAAGMDWAVVPDKLIECVGIPEGSADGVYHAEREGHRVALLARDTRLAAVAAEVPVRDVVARLEERHKAGHALVTVGLQGERFGLHPGSSAQKDRAWLATLLAAVGQARSTLEPRLPSQAVALGADRGRVYLPIGAPEGHEPPWERSLVKYDAANKLHKKMLRVSRLVEKLDRYGTDMGARLRPDPSEVEQARRYLYRAQTSAPYWHGPHAGVYDPRAREIAWRDVLRGEHAALSALRADERLIVERADLDGDGVDDALLYTPEVAIVVSPHGATVTELSPVGLFRNLADVLDRVREPYHAELGPDDPLRAWLGVDPNRRALFRDRFLGPEDELAAVLDGTAGDAAPGLSNSLWEVLGADKHGSDAVQAVLARDATVADARGDARIRVEKRYTLRQRTLTYRQELANRGREILRARQAVVLDLFLGADAAQHRVLVNGKPRGADEPADRGVGELVRIETGAFAIDLHLLQPARVWQHPVRSVHRAHGAWETAIQGLSLWLVRDLVVEPGRKSRFDAKLKVDLQ